MRHRTVAPRAASRPRAQSRICRDRGRLERLYVVLSVCSLSGTITYGSLIRMFWIRILSSRIILAMAVLCVLATSLAFFARAYWEFLGGWWLAAAWWFAFSAGLWYFDTHSDVLPTRRKIPPKRET
jgi:hypothetical protein